MAVIVAALYIVKRVKGIDILQSIALSKPVIAALASAVEAACKLWPNGTLNIVYAVMKAAAQATEAAEKAWLMGNLPEEERNAYAKELAHEVLAEAGIKITPQVDTIISGMIEVVCLLLPHGMAPKETPENKTAENTAA